MTLQEIRLQCLAMARPVDLRNEHDGALIVARARMFEAYVNDGQPALPAAEAQPARATRGTGKSSDKTTT